MNLTILGEKFDSLTDGEYYEEVDNFEVSPKMKPVHHTAMSNIFLIINHLISKNRHLPLMMEELKKMGMSKQVIKDLVSFGFLKITVGMLRNKNEKKTAGYRNFVYWTPQGRAYVRKHFKQEDTNGQQTSNTGITPDSGGVQPEVRPMDGENGLQGQL